MSHETRGVFPPLRPCLGERVVYRGVGFSLASKRRMSPLLKVAWMTRRCVTSPADRTEWVKEWVEEWVEW